MKRRLLALFLLLAMILTLAPAALASDALGWELQRTDTLIGPGVTWTTQTLWGDSIRDYRKEQYVTYTPGQGSLPVVYYGAVVPSTGTLTAMAKSLESWGGRVLAGANGDYFVMSSGVPLGMVVSDGFLRSSASYHYAVGFLPDGSAFVGKPELAITAAFQGYQLAVSGGYNKAREAQGGYTLFSPDMGDNTRGSGAGVNVVLRPVTVPEDYVAPVKPEPFLEPEPEREETEPTEPLPEGELAEPTAWELWRQAKEAWELDMAQWEWDLAWSVIDFESLPAQLSIGHSVTCVVESVFEADGAVPIGEGRFVLSIHKENNDFLVEALEGLAVGERVELSVCAPDGRWSQATSALGAYEWILRNGVVPSGLEAGAAPRTALGVKENGDVILYTIDGRRAGHSMGSSVTQVSKRLLELGCTQAVLFDGGGSTTFGATDALGDRFALQNKPSDGSQRWVTNALFFVSPLQATGELGSLYIQPHSALMLSGAKLDLSARGIDTGYYPMSDTPVSGVTYAVDGPGSVTGSTFTAGKEKGIATVTATAPGGAKGTALMNVVATPDAITVSDAATAQTLNGINLDPGQSIALSAAATWYKLPLLSDNGCFTWEVSEEVGEVDGWGLLTAGPRAASGALSVTAGAKTVTIPITVGGHVHTLEPWEDAGHIPVLELDSPIHAELTHEQVRYGHSALKVEYPSWQETVLPLDMPIQEGESYLGFWYLGDGTPTLEFHLMTADGESDSVEVSMESAEGWQHILLPIPEQTVAIETLSVTPGQADTGAFYLDHLTSSNGPVRDTTAPTARLTWDGQTLTANLSDNTDKTFHSENVKLTLDGWDLGFTLEGSTLTAPLTRFDDNTHRLSLELRDASGNLGRASLDIPGDTEAMPFTDIDGHWAGGYIVYLAQQGVTNGRQALDGSYVFDPQTNITRGEFATMLARWLRSDLSAYEGTQLPFADASDVPSWAYGAVAYLYDAGVMTGSLEGDGQLYANTGDPITRSQAMTMLGRCQAKGYTPQSQLFADDEAIPAWAREFVYTLAGQGVVSGYEGLVRPQDPITRSEVAKLLTTMW